MQLLTNQGIPQSRSSLEESLYGWQQEIESNAIEVHVSESAQKLGAKLIRNRAKYRLRGGESVISAHLFAGGWCCWYSPASC